MPDEFTDYETIHPTIDAARHVCTLPWGVEIPLDPFFGIMGVAPPPAWGRCGSPVRVTQLVDGNKGIHMMLPKAAI